MKNILNFITVLTSFLLLNSCASYTIPVDSFKHQFAGIDSTTLEQVKVRGPMGESYEYPANPIKIIYCLDKNGKEVKLENKPSIEIRFTYGQENKRTVFYFDRVIFSDSNVIGVQSRFISAIGKSIPLNDITKIEVQDGKKDFKYVSRK
ncbi:MAG: hypothetical protein ACKVQV_13710 [Bacteroidia bacterium]